MAAQPGASGTSKKSVRIDKWLWAVRLCKTRSSAKDACLAGRVTIGESIAKPASKVSEGDVVRLRQRETLTVCEVKGLLEKRVSASIAVDQYIDRSPPQAGRPVEQPPPGGARLRGEGRPTKRERRRLDRLRGR